MEKDTVCGSGGDHRVQRRTGNRTDPQVRLVWCGIWHNTQTQGCEGRHVDVAFLATSGCDAAKSSSTSWVHPYHHRLVTYNSFNGGWQHYRGCVIQCSGCASNQQSNVGVPRANIGDQSRACESRPCLFL
ncbi:unnamed protein product [Ascophyllum nodosum]